MELIHYSKTRVTKLVSKPQDREACKPNGLWVSDGPAWKEWCEDEEFWLDSLKFQSRVILQPDANILTLSTPTEIYDFGIQYNSDLPEHLRHMGTLLLNWHEVTKKYQGIIITPYQWGCRLNDMCRWYYGWDCASGCIWDIDAIKELRVEADIVFNPHYERATA